MRAGRATRRWCATSGTGLAASSENSPPVPRRGRWRGRTVAVIDAPREQLEERVRRSVETQLAARLGDRPSARIGLQDQEWVYAMVGRVVAEEHRLAGHSGDHDASVEMWRRVYGAVTPLGPLAEL